MYDETEGVRREMVREVNTAVESNDEAAERARLTESYGDQVWNTQELGEAFEVLSFAAPLCIVRRKSDGRKGSVMFQHSPRFYFQFQEA
jgi:hypothetical protein